MNMTDTDRVNRRAFLKGAGAAAVGVAGLAGGGYWLGSVRRVSHGLGKKVLVIGVDGMDPPTLRRDDAGRLAPQFPAAARGRRFQLSGDQRSAAEPGRLGQLHQRGGPRLAWDLRLHPSPSPRAIAPFYSAAETLPGEGSWEIGDHRLQLTFWPINHKAPVTVLRRQGVPFWDYLDAAKIPSTFYDLPANYPPSPSHHGHHRCLCGMGTPDMLGTHGTYQYFAEDSPAGGLEEGAAVAPGWSSTATRPGPPWSAPKTASERLCDGRRLCRPSRQRSNAALSEVQGRKILLQAGQ